MEQEGKTRVTVSIFGEEYVIRSNASKEYMQKVASYVNRIMEKLAGQNPRMSRHKLAVLTAINLAYELARLKDRNRGRELPYSENEGDKG